MGKIGKHPKKTKEYSRHEIVFTAGVWDLFHIGHLRLLEKARKLGQALIVGVLTDKAAAAYKPKPIIPFKQRFEIIKALKCVDAVIKQDNTDATEILKDIRSGILVHADDHTPDWEIGQTWMKGRDKHFVLLPYTKGVSSTLIKKKICEDCQPQI